MQVDLAHGAAIATLRAAREQQAQRTLATVGNQTAAPARGDLLVARGQVLRAGRTLTVSRADVAVRRDGAETLCATMLQTLMRLTDRPDLPAPAKCAGHRVHRWQGRALHHVYT